MSRVYRQRRIITAVIAAVVVVASVSMARPFGGFFSGSGAEASTSPVPITASDTDACPSDDELYATSTESVPADLQAGIDELLSHSLVTSREVSISVWVDGYGEVVTHNADLALKPASNQKILTAVGALELLDHDQRFTTTVLATSPLDNGVIDGDLVLVGGGDPTLWDVGEHSLLALAGQLRDLGVTQVTGAIYTDDSRYDARRIAQGWTDQQIPGDAAPISALTVKANRLGDTYEYLANPAHGNSIFFSQYLAESGIAVTGGVAPPDSDGSERPPAEVELVSVESPTVAELVRMMMKNSDNTTAELLLKEIGLQVADDPSTLSGLAAARQVLEDWCIDVTGVDDDGSGLSYVNSRSALEWRQILQRAQDQDWWPIFHDALPQAGDANGTLTNRLTGDATVGNLRAKTGTISVAKALSGVFTTVDGRQATFSVIVNGPDSGPTLGPTDELLELIAAHPG
jgi:D-alanyl-D-alanine carboxypeptidase/D-alanyl-D-alanine-endopeptidase (penicillin-binding protein 4)